jgi:hypothetical protein
VDYCEVIENEETGSVLRIPAKGNEITCFYLEPFFNGTLQQLNSITGGGAPRRYPSL